MVKRSDPEYTPDTMVPFGHRIKAGLRDCFNKAAPPRQAGATFSRLIEKYVQNPSIIEGSTASNSGETEHLGDCHDFSHAGLVGIIPDYDTHDFSDIILSAETLYLFGRYLSSFLTFRDHGYHLIDRLRHPEFETHVRFGGSFRDGELWPHEHDFPHYKEIFSTALSERARATVTLFDFDFGQHPHFSLIADDSAFVSTPGFGSSYLLHWVKLDRPCYFTSFKNSITRGLNSSSRLPESDP